MFRDKLTAPIKSLSLLDTMGDEPRVIICYGSPTKIEGWYQKYLKKGFEHCFILYWDGSMWLRLEKTYGYHTAIPLLTLGGVILYDANIKNYFETLGYVCQNVDLSKREERIRCPQVVTSNTCVEFVKDFLGIRKWTLFTPYQLYKYVECKYGC